MGCWGCQNPYLIWGGRVSRRGHPVHQNGVSERGRTPGDSAGRGTGKCLCFLGPEGVAAKEGSSNSETVVEEEL